MIISISLVLLLVAIVATLIATGRLSILGALAAALLGFYAADTAIALPFNTATAVCLDFLSHVTA